MGRHHRLVVLGAEVPRDARRVRALVEERVALEADGERLDAARARGAAMSAATALESTPPESRTPSGHVGDEPLAHGVR